MECVSHDVIDVLADPSLALFHLTMLVTTVLSVTPVIMLLIDWLLAGCCEYNVFVALHCENDK